MFNNENNELIDIISLINWYNVGRTYSKVQINF